MRFNERNRERIGTRGYITREALERREWEEHESSKAKWKEEREVLEVWVEESNWLGPGKLQTIIEEYY